MNGDNLIGSVKEQITGTENDNCSYWGNRTRRSANLCLYYYYYIFIIVIIILLLLSSWF